MTKFGRVVT